MCGFPFFHPFFNPFNSDLASGTQAILPLLIPFASFAVFIQKRKTFKTTQT